MENPDLSPADSRWVLERAATRDGRDNVVAESALVEAAIEAGISEEAIRGALNDFRAGVRDLEQQQEAGRRRAVILGTAGQQRWFPPVS